jgi:hypothetical protein
MSLQLLAKQMESKGRNGDSQLVHMTHGEVAGLQKLAEAAGGSLTVNPETGLVEANFLKSILPTVVGVGVGMVAGPWAGAAAGAAVGGLTAEDGQDPLMAALMGGLGGYGGGTLGAGLGAAGAANAGANAMTQEALAQQAAQQLQEQGVAQAANVAANMGGAAPASIYGTDAGAQAIAAAYEKGAADYASKGFFDQAGAGLQGLGSQTGRDAAMAEIGGSKKLFQAGLMGLSPVLAGMTPEPAESPYPLMSMELDRSKGSAPFQGISAYEAPQPSYNYQGSNVYIPTFTAAKGGIASLEDGGFVVPADVVAFAGGGNTEAGYKEISSRLPGSRPIPGSDGGQDDTVKTSIDGKQPARVAHGEMYVPASTVKRAGGAKKLYAMMDRVREQAVGHTKQARPVDMNRALA